MGRSLTGAGGFVIPGSCVGVESQTPEVSRKVAGGRQTAGPQVDAFIDPGGIAEQVPTSNAVPAARRYGSSLRLCASAGEAGLRVCVPLRNRTCVLGLGVCDPAGVVGLMGPTIRRSFDRRLPSRTPPASGHRTGFGRGIAAEKRGEAGLTVKQLSVSVTDMRVTSRDFQRDFARMKERARSGETILVTSGAEEFCFQVQPTRTWQGALKGKGRIKGDLFSTGLKWEASR